MTPPSPPLSRSPAHARANPRSPLAGARHARLRRALFGLCLCALAAAPLACQHNARASGADPGPPPAASTRPVAGDQPAPPPRPAPRPTAEGDFPAPQAHPTAAAANITLLCSVDPEAAAPILRKFQDMTGITVHTSPLTPKPGDPIFQPRAADVFWTAEPCEMFDLDAAGRLAPYHSESGDRHAGGSGWPPNFRAADHTWYALGRRLRVLAYNPAATAGADLPKTWMDLAEARWKGKVAMSAPNPSDSTTTLQLAAMRAAHGDAFLREWCTAVVANGLLVVPDDAAAVAAVANGRAALGLTSSDAAIQAAERGLPIRFRILGDDGPLTAGKARARVMEFDPGQMQIPQAIALARNAPNPEAGAVLIDFLLSNEIALLQSMGAARLVGLAPMSVPGFSTWCDGATGLGSRQTLAIRPDSFHGDQLAEHTGPALEVWHQASAGKRDPGSDK